MGRIVLVGEKVGNEVETVLSEEEKLDRQRELEALIEMIRPAVQGDGGDLMLVSADVESGIVKVMLVGSCSSCAISETTLKAGIERILTGRLPWVTKVVGDVDESIEFEDSYAMGRGGYVPKF